VKERTSERAAIGEIIRSYGRTADLVLPSPTDQ